MKIAAIGDIHLPGLKYYPKGYLDRIVNEVKKELPYILLISGDLSDSYSLNRAIHHLKIIEELSIPVKIAVPGNHDKWYNNKTALLFRNPHKLMILDGTSFVVDNKIGIAGIMGWFDYSFSSSKLEITPPPGDVMRVEKEIKKLKAALYNIRNTKIKILLMHYSPIINTVADDPLVSKAGSAKFLDIILENKVDYVFHGHAHNTKSTLCYRVNNTQIYNVTANILDFRPLFIELDI